MPLLCKRAMVFVGVVEIMNGHRWISMVIWYPYPMTHTSIHTALFRSASLMSSGSQEGYCRNLTCFGSTGFRYM